MKQNPFYGLSAAAMLGGCYLVSHALKLEAGHLGKLVALVGILQVYEALLLALGAFLVSTGRAPRDGVTVLMLETLFLMDAPLLALECVTADPAAGALVSVALFVLAVGKLMLLRRWLPDTLSREVAMLVGLQALLVLGVPVVASQLAAARLLAPVSLYGLWWLALALPLAQKRLLEATRASEVTAASSAHAAWSWLPAASVLLHLWAIGWIHQVSFQMAFLTPFLLGLALAAERDQVVRQVVLPVLAVTFSLGQAETLGQVLSTPTGAPVSVLRLSLLGAGATFATLAWRHGYRWLVALAAVLGLGAAGGAPLPSVFDALGSLLRFFGRLLPRNALGWGLTGIVGSFVLLALGAGRSLGATRPRPPRGRTRPHLPRLSGSGFVTVGLLAGFLSAATALSAFDAHPFGHPRQHSALLEGGALAAVALYCGIQARSRASDSHPDTAVRTVATLALLAGIGGLLLSSPAIVAFDRHAAIRAEMAVLADVRTVQSAQAAYRSVNGGFADARLTCLAEPSGCLADYPPEDPPFLDSALALLEEKGGYVRSFHPGSLPDAAPLHGSRTSVQSFAYVAVPTDPGYTGIRGFCGDSNGNVCFTVDGSAPPLLEDATCDLSACAKLE